MKIFSIMSVVSCVLLTPLVSHAQMPRLVSAQIITVNTDDPEAYRAWAEQSLPVMAEAMGMAAMGMCRSAQGARRLGDMYGFAFASSHGAMIGSARPNPTVAREIGKVAAIRTVIATDLWSVLKPPMRLRPLGATFSLWNLTVQTDSPSDYVAALGQVEGAFQANGFDDIDVAAYLVNTGEFAGRIVASIAADTPERLGAMFDSLSEPWAREQLVQLEGKRDYVRGEILHCQLHAVNP